MIRLVVALLALTPAAIAAPHCSAQWTHGPRKIRPYSTGPVRSAEPLICARNAYCSFQVVLEASGGDCRGFNATVSGFRNSHGEELASSSFTLYRQGFVNVFYRSSEQGDIGEWPDPLIPSVDPEFSEKRRALPVDISLISSAYKSYRAERGRTLSKGRGSGIAISGGSYKSNVYQRLVLRISKGGALGAARFVWWNEPGVIVPSPELPVQTQPVPLANGITVRFEGAGRNDDFHLGDEFWIFAGPTRRQPLWIDVFIPESARPGVYRGLTQATFDSHPAIYVPIEFEVAAARLPSSSALATHFGFYLRGTYEYHFATYTRVEEKLRELARAYASAALRNRITIETTDEFDPDYLFDGEGQIRKVDYSRYAAAWGDFLDGKNTPHGAKWSSLRMPRFRTLSGAQLISAARDFSDYANKRGWSDRLFDYTADEPGSPEQYATLRQRAQAMQAAAPNVPRLATTPLQKSLFGIVTRWCPLIESYFYEPPLRLGPRSWLNWWRERNAWRLTPADYSDRVRTGDSLWLYISCTGHGCAEAGRYPAHKDAPSFVIDAPATVNQLALTLAGMTPNVTGFLYWDISYADHHEGGPPRADISPWESMYYFGGNGEGSLFYPGLPEQLGGTNNFPVESLRLKFIRESLMDSALLNQLRVQRKSNDGDKAAKDLVRSPKDWESDPEAWVAFRNRLLRSLSGSEIASSGASHNTAMRY